MAHFSRVLSEFGGCFSERRCRAGGWDYSPRCKRREGGGRPASTGFHGGTQAAFDASALGLHAAVLKPDVSILELPRIGIRASISGTYSRTVCLPFHCEADAIIQKELAMASQIHFLLNEADIGSGEKSEGERETEKLLEQVPKQGEQTADDALNDARAEQQMIEGNADTSETYRRIERKHVSHREASGTPPVEADPAAHKDD